MEHMTQGLRSWGLGLGKDQRPKAKDLGYICYVLFVSYTGPFY